MSFEASALNPKKADFGHINFTPKAKKRILIIGNCRHGKDTAAGIIQKLYGYKFESSSVAASRIFLYDALKDKYGYKDHIECFNDRVNRRKEWHDLICEYNKVDPSRLAKEILKESDMYVGMRSDIELNSCMEQGIFDYVIGVFDPRKELESSDSFTINFWEQCHFVIPNASSIENLERNIKKLSPIFY